jgi:hypothetical protein
VSKLHRDKATEPPYRLPHFELARLQGYPVDVFNSSDRKVDAFVLMLAHVYNEIKVPYWIARLMKTAKEADGVPLLSGYRGQISGFEEWVNRQVSSVSHELLKLLDKERDLLESDILKKCVSLMGPAARRSWRNLVAASRGDDTAMNPVKAYLVRIRNNVGFHYYQPKSLLAGYDDHFFRRQDIPTAIRDLAYASIDNNMEGTRFFFADAAAQSYTRHLEDPDGTLYNETNEVIHEMNVALFSMVQVYLLVRTKRLGVKPVKK